MELILMWGFFVKIFLELMKKDFLKACRICNKKKSNCRIYRGNIWINIINILSGAISMKKN